MQPKQVNIYVVNSNYFTFSFAIVIHIIMYFGITRALKYEIESNIFFVFLNLLILTTTTIRITYDSFMNRGAMELSFYSIIQNINHCCTQGAFRFQYQKNK